MSVIVIGAGAAGLMAAIACPGATVLEKMPRPARKLMITGKGRCNFTNVKPWQEFSGYIHPKANVIRPAFHTLTPEKLTAMFETAGLPCVVERGQRAFPESQKAVDVVDCLVRMVRNAGSNIICNCSVTEVFKDDTGFHLSTSTGINYRCDKLIITCGGLSYPATGSTGDGHRIAATLGHKVVRTFPSLTALVPRGYKISDRPEAMAEGQPCKLNHWIPRERELGDIGKKLIGRNIRNVSTTLFIDKQKVQEEFGDLEFTDGGLEGPIGYKISRKAVNALENGGKVAVEISFKNEEKPLRFEICGFVGYERAVVTAGGVSTDEIIPKTMESRLVKGLYFAGEVLDVDADTGGYNLHIAFSTGFLAGLSATEHPQF